MTLVGLEYLKQQEAKRSNLARESEAHRSNVASEQLTSAELRRKQQRDTWEEQLASRKQQQDAALAAGADLTWYGREYQGTKANSGQDIMNQVVDGLRLFLRDVGAKTLFSK